MYDEYMDSYNIPKNGLNSSPEKKEKKKISI